MKQTISKLTLPLAAILWAAASSMASAAPPHTGIQGQAFVYISYGTPVEAAPGVWIGIPSVQFPVATSFTVLSAHNQREVARITTDANGLYSLSLPPGSYSLVPDTLTLNPFFNCTASTEPIEVIVQAKQFTPANIFYFRQGPCSIGTPILIGSNVWVWLVPTEAQVQGVLEVPGTLSRDITLSVAPSQDNQGHHQSGITGRVAGGVIIATPTGEGSSVVPDIVRVYSDSGELVAEVETEVEGNAWWHFRVNLKPGNYTVTASMPGGYPFSYPVGGAVEKKQFTEANFTFPPI